MISIDLILTTYNDLAGARVLEHDLSLYSQKFNNVIIVDDYSSDGTYEYLRKIVNEFSNISIFRTRKNSGRPSVPRNLGIRNAKSRHITFLDLGDRLPLSYIEHVIAQLAIDEDVVYSGVKFTTPSPLQFEQNRREKTLTSYVIPKWLLKFKMWVLLSGLTLKKEVAAEIGFAVEFHEDWHFIQKIARKHKIVQVHCPILYNQGSVNLSPSKLKQLARVYSRHRRVSFIVAFFFLANAKFLQELTTKMTQIEWKRIE